MKKLFTAIILFFLVFNCLSLYSQGIIKGFVTDSLTADQIKGAKIIISGTLFSTVSNSDGEFSLKGIPNGDYILQTSYYGYKGKEYLVNVNSKETQNINIKLVPDITETNLSSQIKSQFEVINLQQRSDNIKNIISEKKLKYLPDENIPLSLSRLPGISIIYRPIQNLFPLSEGIYEIPLDDIWFPPKNDFPIADNPVSRIFIRGLDSKYSSINVDGVRIIPTSATERIFDLSIFSESDFSNIELYKTITSEEDADATAGSIKLITGKAPSHRVLNARILGNYNNFDKSANQYNFFGNYGERFLKNSFGVQVNLKTEKRNISSEYQKNNIDITSLPSYYSYTEGLKKGYNINILFDYNTPDGGSIKFKNIYSKSSIKHYISQIDTVFDIYTPSDNNYTPVNHVYHNREIEQKLLFSSIGGNNHFLGFDIDWNAAFSESKIDHPFDFKIYSEGVLASTAAAWDLEESLRNTIDNSSKNYSNEKSLFVDIFKKYIISSELAGKFKFGGKYRTIVRSYDENLYLQSGDLIGNNLYRKLADGTLVKKDYTGTRFEGVVGKPFNKVFLSFFKDNVPKERTIFDIYKIELLSNDAVRLWRQLNLSEYYFTDGLDINSYNLSESILAGYISHQLNIGEWVNFIAGVRIETEDNIYSGFYFPKKNIELITLYNGQPLKTNNYSNDKTNILANFHLVLKPTGFLNLRLAAYKTIIKPDYSARVPKYLCITYNSNNLIMGNPSLKNADVWNYELQNQFYGKLIGLLSISAFYKDIKGMQHATNGLPLTGAVPLQEFGIDVNSLPTGFPYKTNNYNTFTYYNSPKPTRIWGFEVEHQANFLYLPGLLKNIVLNYNITILRSETWIKDREQQITDKPQWVYRFIKQRLGNIPEFFANVNLGYDIKGFSFRISYFYQAQHPILEDYQKYYISGSEYSRLDIALRQQVLENIFIMFNLNNITNSKEESSFRRNPQVFEDTNQVYRSGMNLDFGIGINL